MRTFLLAVGLLLACGSVAAQQMWVTGYYPYWAIDAMPPQQMNWNGLTHVIHFFARPEQVPPYFGPAFNANDAGQLIWGTDQGHAVGERSNPDTLIKYAHMHGVKVVLSLGGIYGGQDAIVDFISRDQARTSLWIKTAGEFCRKYGYDGMELDWERPVNLLQVGRIISTMRVELDSWPVRGTLVVAAPGWGGNADMYAEAIGEIDQYNIMGYDLQRPSNICCNDVGPAGVTGFNAALHRADPTLYPIVSAISDNYDGIAADAYTLDSTLVVGADRLRFGPRYCIETLGWDPRKVGMGVPFYGYVYPDVTAPNQYVANSYQGYMQYRRAADALAKGGTYTFDLATQTPWIGGVANDTIFEPYRFTLYPGRKFYMTYDDTNSIKAKVSWAKGLRLGGMMIYALDEGWVPEAPAGSRDPLLRSLVSALANAGDTGVPAAERWNLVSIPYGGGPSTPDSLFPGNPTHMMYGYNADSVIYRRLPPEQPRAATGYWIIDAAGTPGAFPGSRIDSLTINVTRAGWVMVAAVTDSLPASNLRSEPDGAIVAGTLYAWDAATQRYTASPEVIAPGKAYWVLVNQACVLRLGK
jgi:chitinase